MEPLPLKKIMIVDDNCLSAEGIEKNIDWSLLHAQVIHVKYSGSSALEALKKEPVDIIISDIEMPDLDGISMSKLALSLNPFTKVILISAYDKFEYAKRAIRIGVYDYIEKPMDYGYLTEKIKNAIAAVDRERNHMELIEKSRPLMVEKFFHGLLHLPANEAAFQLSSYAEYLDLNLEYRYFAAMVFRLDNTGALKEEMGIAQFQMLLYNIHDTAKDFCRIFDQCYLLREFDGFICILFQNCSLPNHFLQSIHKTADLVVSEYDNSGIALHIGIGNVVPSLWELNVSYESALRALEYRFFLPQQNIFDAKEAFGQDLKLEPFSDTKEDELIRFICRKDSDALAQWIENFSTDILKQYRSKQFVFIRIYSLLGRILKFLYELNLETADLEEKIIKAYNNPEIFATSQQFFAWLFEICTLACCKLDTSLKTYHQQLCNSVIGFIQENYENSALSLHDIAQYAGVSPAYLSALFKKNQKVSISDTITSCRIDAACQYLLNSSLSLKEISEKCGYANQYYFSTSFKKKMGVSPSAYRTPEK